MSITDDILDLRSLLSLLSTIDNWARNSYACTSTSTTCEYDNPDATRWCLEGAWLLITDCHPTYVSGEFEEIHRLEELLFPVVEIGSKRDIVQYNDTHSYQEVVELISTTINRLSTD